MAGFPRRIEDAYSQVERWRLAAVGQELQAAEAVEQAIAEHEASIAELREAVAALEAGRDAVYARADAVAGERDTRTYEAFFEILLEQSLDLEVRGLAMREAEDQDDSRWLRLLAASPLAKQLAEYVEYRRKIEPGLSAFPDEYGSTVRQHHDEVKAELVAWFESQDLALPKLELRELTLDVVVGVDEPEDGVAVVMVVLPVPSAVQARWAERPAGIGLALAARAVEGLYKAAHHMGYRSAQVLFGGHRGLIAIELEVEGDPYELGSALAGAVQAALDRSPDLESARVRAQVSVVNIDHLLPADVFSEVSDAG